MLALALLACNGPDPGDKPPGDDDDDTTTETGTPGSDRCDDHPGEAWCDGDDAITCDDRGDVVSVETCGGTDVCSDGACVSCAVGAVEVPYADPTVLAERGFRVEVDGATQATDRLPYLRPLVIHAGGTLGWTGPLELFQVDGVAVANGDQVAAGTTLLARGAALGAGTLTLTADACAAELAYEAGLPHGLAGRPLDGSPWFETPSLFSFEDDDVSVLVDPGRWFDRVGQPFDAYVVPWRSPEDWLADPTLTGAVAGPVAGTVPAAAEAGSLVVWADPTPGPGLAEGYALVVDFGQDGRLDPGDLVDGYDGPGLHVSADLAAPGPWTATSAEVSLDYWRTFLVYWPDELDQLDPMPLVVISHGNGHKYFWYDYLGNHFASHGYVTIVHRNDTADTSIEPAADTTWTNTEAFLANLPTIGGGILDGEVDPDRIAWIGHSRGGEGVVIAYNWLERGLIAPTSYSADDIELVVSIAPTVWTTAEIANPLSVPVYAQIDGSADGDVTGGVDSDIVEYFRIFQGHTELGAVVYVQGADHNDFNCCGINDGAGVGPGPLIGRQAAQHIAKSYLLAMLRAVFDGDEVMWEYLGRPPERFRPPGVEDPVTLMLKRSEGDPAFVIDDFQTEPDLAISSSGGAVTATVANLAEGSLDDADTNLTATLDEPFNGFTWSEQGDDLPDRGAVFDWADGSDLSIEWEIVPQAQDWSNDTFLSLRACQRTRHPYTDALDGQLSFTVEVQDADGNVAAVDHRVYGGINPPFARDGSGVGVGWVNEFQTIRIPVADLQGVDLTRIVTLRLRFGAAWGSAQGAIGIDDVVLLQEVLP